MSVDVFTIFNEIIDNDFKLNTDPLIIEEKKNKGNDKSKGRYVTLKKTGKIFVFSFDKDEEKLRVFRFFNNSAKDINKKNDAIILCENKGEIYVLLIELKSGKIGGALKQLLSGKIFVDFIVSLINLHYGKNLSVKYRGIVFSTRKTPKKKPTKRLTKRGEIIYKNHCGLECTIQDCNREYNIFQFLCS